MEKTKRILSFFIALLMILTIIPMNAIVLALEADDSAETQTQDSSEKEPVKDPVENADLKIGTVAELKAFADRVNKGEDFAGETVVLTADIDLTGVVWTPIGSSNYDKTPANAKAFAGTFDGQNYTINGLSSEGYVPSAEDTKSTEYSFGLFGYVYGANIKNVKFTDVSINCCTIKDSAGKNVCGSGVAALVGYYFPANGKTAVIENCHVLSGSVTASNNMGGLIGHMDSQTSQPKVDITIKDCSNAAAVTTEAREAGGILGLMNSAREGNYYVTMSGTVLFENCVNTGAITSLGGGAPSAGGILGRDHNQAAGQRLKIVFDDCTNSGLITVTANGETHAAGIGAGYYSNGAWFVVKNCSNTGNVVVNGTGDVYAGGLVSYAGVIDLIDSTSTGTVTGGTGNTYVGNAQQILFLEGMADYNDTITGNTYYLNGGVSPEYAALVDDAAGGGNFHLVETACKTGFEFAGWYTNPEFTGEAVTALVSGVKTYYAKWNSYAASIGNVYYKTVAEAIAAAKDGDTVVIGAGEYGSIDISNKNITLQGTVGANGELLTTIKGGNPAITGHGFNGTIKDIKVVDAFKVMYAEPAGNVTVDNVYVTGATYGFHLVAYSTGLTWTIQNSYMDLSWANSFGVYNGGDAAIVVKGNTFASTNPYYPEYGALPVNTFVSNVTVERNIFGANTKIKLTDASEAKISKNYHADGVENAFAEDSQVTVDILSYYTGVAEDGKLTGLVQIGAACIGDECYATLQDAINAVKDMTGNVTITLLGDITENVTINEKVGLYLTIDGGNNTMNGKFVVNPLSNENDNRLISFVNIKFVNTSDSAVDFINCVATNHYPRLAVQDCTFTGNGKDTDVAIRVKTAYGLTINDCTGTGLHSFIQNTAGRNITIENVTVTESKSGFALGAVQGVTVKGCTLDVAEYGIRFDAQYNNNAVIESCKVNAFIPVVVRKASVASNITFKGTNTMTQTNTDEKWCVIGTSEYEENGKLPTAPGADVTVTLSDAGLKRGGVCGGKFTTLAGTGTAEDPYLISSVADWKLFAELTKNDSFSGKVVKLANDIDFGGANFLEIAEDGTVITDYRISKFNGTFDGGNYTVKNFNFVVKSAYKGAIMMFSQDSMWAYIRNLKIENVNVTVADITGETRISALANRVNAGGMTSAAIENVHIKNYTINCTNTTSTDLRIGGFAYYVQGSQLIAKDCSITNFTVNANSALIVGGAVSVVKSKCDFVNVDVFNAVFNIDNNMTNVVGGFAGQTESNGTGTTFTDCDVNVKMTFGTIATDIGGFVASIGAASQFYNCTTTGSITVTKGTSNNSIGGFVGNLGWNGMGAPNTQHEFKNCVADVNITAVYENVGGFIGDSTISGYPDRFIPAYFNNCVAKGDVETTNGVAGGFVGRGDRGIFNDCSASGNVEGRIAGGFWGELYPKAQAESKGGWSYDKKEVTHTDANAKTIVLQNLTVTGEVSGTEYEAGLIGFVKDIYVGGNNELGYATPVVLAGNSTNDMNRYEYPQDEVDPLVWVAEINGVKYATLEEAFAAAQAGDTITLLANATPALKSQYAITKAAVIDLNNFTLTLTEDDLYFGTTTFQNGTIVVDSSVNASTAVFWMFENQTLIFNEVEIIANGVTGTYLIGINGGTGTSVQLINSSIKIENASIASLSAVICDNGTGNSVVIDGCDIDVANIEGRFYLGGKNGRVTVEDSAVTLNGVKEGFYLRAGQALAINGTSVVDITLNTNEGRYGINITDRTATYAKADTATVKATVYAPKAYVAQVNGEKFETLADALAAAQAGNEVILLADAAEDVTIPAGVIFNGNGKQVGVITAAGEITFKGHTKATNFGVKYTNTTINIIEGACLELTGTGRMVIGHGCTFNITGTITGAKTADKADITPSLIAAGASFTGAGVNFNVTNAYVKFTAYCSSKNSSANGTFNFNVENSIWEQTGSFVFSEPTNGMDPTFNLTLKNSVLDSTSHLVFAVAKGEIVFDNSNVNVGTSRQIENRSTMTIKNGSVVNGAVATSSNAINPGTIIVENATYAVTGQFSGAAVGTGTLIIKNGATVSVGSIVDKANIVIDATGMTAGDEVNFTGNLSKFTGTIEVINNDKLEAKIVDGKIVLSAKPVAKIGETYYATLADAIAAAQAGETVVLLVDSAENVTISKSITLDGANKQYTGKITVSGNVDVTIQNVKFETGAIEHSSVNSRGNLTVKNCSFANGGYAVTTANINSVTIEDCTVTNQSLLYAKKSTVYVTVKNVTVSSGNYVAHLVYGLEAYFENVKATEMTGYGIYTQNYGAKTITIKDCSFDTPNYNSISVREDRSNAIDTFVFEGTNVMTSLENVDKANYVLGSASAKLTAPEGLTVTTTVEGCTVKYVDGTYSVAKVVATVNGVAYTTLADALAAAQAGETITLLADITSSDIIVINKSITLDGNGKTLTSTAGRAINVDCSGVVTIKNLTITGTGNCERGINIINKAGTTNVENVTISGISHYAVHVATSAGAVKLNINESSLTGYAAVAIYGVGSTVNVNDSTLVGINTHANNGSNSFSTIAIGSNVTVNVTGGSITASTSDGHDSQAIIGAQAGVTGTTTVLDAELIIEGNAKYVSMGISGNTVKLRAEYADDINAEGYTAAIENGMATVMLAVAKSGDTYYATLADAIKAGGNVTLLADIALTEGVVVEAGNTVVLDLAGYTITGNAVAGSAYAVITNRGTLTITNGTVVCNNAAASTAYAVNTITNCGTLTIDGATITNASTVNGQIGYAIDNNSTSANAVLVIKGESTISVSGSNYYDGIRMFCNSTTNENSVSVENGTVSSIWMQNPSDGATNNTKAVKGSVSISGGEVNALYLEPSSEFSMAITDGYVGSISSTFGTASSTETTIPTGVTGGTFGSDVSAFCADGFACVSNGDGTYGIVNGVIEVTYADGTVAYFNNILDAVPFKTNYDKLEGATIKLLANYTGSGIRFVENDMVLDLNGFTYTINEGTGSNTSRTQAFQIRATANKVVIKNGTIAIAAPENMDATWGKIAWVFNAYTNLVLEDITVDCTNLAWSYGSSCKAIHVQADQTVEFKGEVNIENFNLDISGNVIALSTGAKLIAEEGVIVTPATSGNIIVYANGTYSSIVPVAQIGDTYYATFEDAVNAIPTDGTDVVIKILTDIELTNSIDFNYGTGKITFTADTPVVIKQTKVGLALRFKIGNAATIVVDENVTFEIYDNASGMYVYYGPSLVINGSISGGQNWGCLYLYNGTHLVSTTGSINVGRLQIARTELTVLGAIDTNYLLVEGAGFIANGATIEVGAIHDSNNGDTRWGASNFSFLNGTVVNANTITLKYADSVINLDLSSSITANKIEGIGKIVIDVSGFNGTATQVIKADMSKFTGTVELVNGKAAYEVTDSGLVIKTAPVAQIGDVYYATLAEAIANAVDGNTITLLANIDLGTTCVTVKGKELTINLNGYNITGSGFRVLFVDLKADENKNGKLTLTGNGTVENTGTTAGNSYAVYVGGNSELVVEADVTVKSAKGYAVVMLPMGAGRVSTLTVNGGTVTGRYAVSGQGTLTDTSTVVTVNGGAIIGTDVAIYQPQPGTVTVNGGTVTGNGDAAIAMRRGTLTINDGVINGVIDVYGDYSPVTATINGGDFKNATLKYKDGNTVTKAASVKLAAPEGYKWNDEGVLVACVYVAQVGDVKYESLAEALQAAIDSGASELKILGNVREKMVKDFDLVIKADLTITADAPVNVEFYNEGTSYDFAVGSTNENKLTIGKNVSFDLVDRVIWIGFWGNNVDVVVEGYLGGYQIWHGADTTVTATGTLDSHGEAFIMRRDATLTVDGGKVNANYFHIYSGHIVAEDAAITAGLVWIYNNHSYGSEGTVSFALDNTSFTSNGVVTVYAGEGKNVPITLTNGSTFTAAGALTLGENTSVVADATSDFTAKNKSVFVASANGYKYTTLQAAIDAAQAGDTVVLLADIALTKGVTVTGNVTIDLAGYNITMEVASVTKSTFVITNNGTLTIENSTEEIGEICLTYTGAKNGGASISTIGNYGTLNIEGGKINCVAGNQNIAYAIDSFSVLANDAIVNISGGVVCGGKSGYCIRMFMGSTTVNNVLNVTGGTVEYVWAQNTNAAANKATISVTGGTVGYVYVAAANGVACDVSNVTLSVNVANTTYAPYVGSNSDKYVVKTIDGAYVLAECNYVAEVNGVKYETLADAIAVGGNVKLIADATVDAVIEIAEGNTVVLDLNGYTIDAGLVAGSTTNHIYVFHNYGTFTITGDGEINTRGIFNYGTMTLESGTINAIDCNGGYGVRNYAGATFTMTGGTIATTYEDGDKPGSGYDACPVRVDKGATFIMNAGEINNISNYTVAIDNYGTTTINGGTFTTIHTTIANSGTMTINGGTFTCNGLEGVTAHAVWAAAGKLTINGGTFNGKDNYNGFNVDASEGANVVITGGTFLSVHSGSLYGEGTIVVSGGTFFDAVPEDRCAEGYIPFDNGDGTYGVKVGSYVAQVGNVKYETLAEALAADGNVVTLLVPFVVNARETVVLDLNGKTLVQSVECTASYEMILNKGTLTIMNGTVRFTDTSAGDANADWGSYTVRNEGTLVVENATIENLSAQNVKGQAFAHTSLALFQYSGNTTITNSTISSPNYRSIRLWKGDMVINSGNFVGQVWVQAVDNSAKLTINGGTFANTWNDASAVFVENSKYNVALAVTGGTFNGKIGCSDAAKLAGAITGGTFTATAKNGTNAALLASGYEFVENADGTYGVEKEKVIVIDLRGTSLELKDATTIKYHIYNDTYQAIVKDLYVVVTISHKDCCNNAFKDRVEIIKYNSAKWEINKGTTGGRGFDTISITGIAAKEMGCKVTLDFYTGAAELATVDQDTPISVGQHSTSIVEYAKKAFASSNESLKGVMYAMLVYGAEAQKAFHHAEDKLVSDMLKDYEQYATAFTEGNRMDTPSDDKFVGSSLVLTDATSIVLFFKASEIADKDAITGTATYTTHTGATKTVNIVYHNGGTVTVGGEKVQAYAYRISGISVADIGAELNIKLMNGSEVFFEGKYSVEARAMLGIDSNVSVDIYKAMITYYKVAKAHLAK